MTSITYKKPIHPDWDGKLFGYVKVVSFSHETFPYGNYWNTITICCNKKQVLRSSTLTKLKANRRKKCEKCKEDAVFSKQIKEPSSALELARQDFYLGKPIRLIDE